MASTKFENRVNYETYASDTQVHFGVAEARQDPEQWVGLPERLVARLVTLGEAYELAHVSMIDIYDDTVLRSKQCENIYEELGFLAGVVHDDALQQVLTNVAMLVKKIRKNSSLCLMVSGN